MQRCTKLLTEFPDVVSDNGQGAGGEGDKDLDTLGNPYTFTGPKSGRDKQGYLLYDHDAVGGDGVAALVSYLDQPQAAYCYTAERDGTVRQYLEDGTEQTS